MAFAVMVKLGAGSWVVPPRRAVWIPAEVAHSHRAHGPTRMLALVFTVNPLRLTRPAVLAVSPLLREVVIALTGDELDARQRRNVERAAPDQLRVDPARPFSGPAGRRPAARDRRVLARQSGRLATGAAVTAVAAATE